MSPSRPPSISRRRASHSSSIDVEDPYPADMPRPSASRQGSGVSSIKGMSKEEIRERERLVNEFEAEEEMIMNKLGRRLEELRQHSLNISQTMEAESESIVNRLQRQLRVVEAQLAAVQSGSGGVGEGVAQAGVPNSVGLQTFLSGSDPVVMGNIVEGLRAEKIKMQEKIDSLSNENDVLRQELIGLRSRLHIPVDDLIGLAPPPRQSTPTGPTSPIPTSTTTTSQPISFARAAGRPNHRSTSPAHPRGTSSSATTTTTNSSPDQQGSYAYANSGGTGMTSYSPSYSSYPVPVVPQNTFAAVSGPSGRVASQGAGGMSLTYPSVPPPSLATSLASTAAVSPVSSPTHSRRPSQGAGGRVAEQGSFARGRVESFGTGMRRVEREKGMVQEERD